MSPIYKSLARMKEIEQDERRQMTIDIEFYFQDRSGQGKWKLENNSTSEMCS